MDEIWFVEDGTNLCQVADDNVLWQMNTRDRPTAFNTKSSAQRAIDRTLQYAKRNNLPWDGFKVVRFSRG